MLKIYDLASLETLLSEENPQQIAYFLDDLMFFLVQFSDAHNVANLSDKCHTLRLLRDSFQKTTPKLSQTRAN